MTWLPESNGGDAGEASRVTTADARVGYRVFLGREPEDREALLTKRSLTFASLVHGFLQSNEFAADVAGPVMDGRDWGPGRFKNVVDQRSATWAARHLATDPGVRARVHASKSWLDLYVGLMHDAGFMTSLRTALGATAAEQFQNGLSLAMARALTAKSASDGKRLPLGVGPRISVVVVAADIGADRLAAIASAMCAQSYSRWELILVHDGTAEDVRSIIDLLAGLGPRIKVDTLVGDLSLADLTRAGVDVASGDYLLFPVAAAPMQADALARLAFEAIAQARPPIVVMPLTRKVNMESKLDAEHVLVSVTFAAAADDEALVGLLKGDVSKLAARSGASGGPGRVEWS